MWESVLLAILILAVAAGSVIGILARFRISPSWPGVPAEDTKGEPAEEGAPVPEEGRGSPEGKLGKAA